MTSMTAPSASAFMAAVPAMSGGNTPFAARYARELRDVIVRQAHRSPRNMQRTLGPSEIGSVCDRQVVGKFAGEPETNHVSDPWASVVGTAVHAKLAEFFALENGLNGYVRWVPEQRVSAHPLYPGTADLYDGVEEIVVDHKVLGPTSMAKVMSPDGPPRHYQVQLLLYAAGYRNLGLPVKRVILAAYPRTSATLDSMYCWEHTCSPADDLLIADVLDETAFRREVARRVMSGAINIGDVPITPSSDGCFWCPFYRPESARDDIPGCPGHSPRDSRDSRAM
jgi:hypothetical protein